MTTPIKVEQAFAQAVWEALKGDHTDLRKQAMILEAHRTARIAAEAKAFEEAARIAEDYPSNESADIPVIRGIAFAIRSRIPETDQ